MCMMCDCNWGCSSVAERLFRIQKVGGSIPSISKIYYFIMLMLDILMNVLILQNNCTQMCTSYSYSVGNSSYSKQWLMTHPLHVTKNLLKWWMSAVANMYIMCEILLDHSHDKQNNCLGRGLLNSIQSTQVLIYWGHVLLFAPPMDFFISSLTLTLATAGDIRLHITPQSQC